MAALTRIGTNERHVIGDLVMRFFTVTGVSGDTIDTGQQQIKAVLVPPGSTITGYTVSGSTVTLTTGGGAITEQLVVVISRVG